MMRLRPLTTPFWMDRRPKWLTIVSVSMSLKEKIALGLLVSLMVVSGFMTVRGYINRNTDLIPQHGGSYREATIGQPRYLNPILAGANDLDADISRLVYSSLFKFDKELNIVNDLATDYSISEDEKQYTIMIRDDVLWHDGEKLTAEDIVFTIRSIKTPDYGSPLENSFQGVEVEKVDDHTVRFTLQEPYAPFLANLTVGIAPKHVWENISPKNASLAEQMLKPVGSGPFKFSEIITKRRTGEVTSVRLVKNKEYYQEPAYLDEFSFAFFNTNEEAVQALIADKVDGLSWLSLSHKDKFNFRTSYEIHRLLLPQYFSLFYNQEKTRILEDDNVRQALTLATERETIIEEALDGEGDPLQLPLPEGLFGYSDEGNEPVYDPSKAKEILEEGGWVLNSEGVRTKDGKPLKLKITTTDWPEYIKTAEIIKKQWGNIGVEVELEHLGAGSIQQTAVGPRDYEVLLYGQILPPIPDPYPFWHSTRTETPGLNLSLVKDEELDKTLEAIRTTSDETKRLEEFTKFQDRIADINPATILYRPYYLFSQKDDVQGVDVKYISLPADRYNNVEDWHVETKRIWKN